MIGWDEARRNLRAYYAEFLGAEFGFSRQFSQATRMDRAGRVGVVAIGQGIILVAALTVLEVEAAELPTVTVSWHTFSLEDVIVDCCMYPPAPRQDPRKHSLALLVGSPGKARALRIVDLDFEAGTVVDSPQNLGFAPDADAVLLTLAPESRGLLTLGRSCATLYHPAGKRTVSFTHQHVPAPVGHGFTQQPTAAMDMRGVPTACAPMADKSRLLVGCEGGAVYYLHFDSPVPGKVSKFARVEVGDAQVTPSCLCVLSADPGAVEMAFVGSMTGCARVVAVHISGSCLQVVRTFEGAPGVTDMVVFGQDIALTSGERPSGSISTLRPGVVVNEISVTDQPGAAGVWALRDATSTASNHILLGFGAGTRVFAVGNDVEQCTLAGVDETQATVAAGSLWGGMWVQVTTVEVRVISAKSKELVCRWTPPLIDKGTGTSVAIACADVHGSGQVVVGAGAGLYYLEVSGRAVLMQASRVSEAGYRTTALSFFHPEQEEAERERRAADVVFAASEPPPSAGAGQQPPSVAILSAPELVQLGSVSVRGGSRVVSLYAGFVGAGAQATPSLAIGTSAGRLYYGSVNASALSVGAMTMVDCGPDPVTVSAFLRGTILASGDRPVLVVAGRAAGTELLEVVDVSLRRVKHACCFSSPHLTSGMTAFLRAGQLALGQIRVDSLADGGQRVLRRCAVPGDPTRLCYHPLYNRIFALCENVTPSLLPGPAPTPGPAPAHLATTATSLQGQSTATLLFGSSTLQPATSSSPQQPPQQPPQPQQQPQQQQPRSVLVSLAPGSGTLDVPEGIPLEEGETGTAIVTMGAYVVMATLNRNLGTLMVLQPIKDEATGSVLAVRVVARASIGGACYSLCPVSSTRVLFGRVAGVSAATLADGALTITSLADIEDIVSPIGLDVMGKMLLVMDVVSNITLAELDDFGPDGPGAVRPRAADLRATWPLASALMSDDFAVTADYCSGLNITAIAGMTPVARYHVGAPVVALRRIKGGGVLYATSPGGIGMLTLQPAADLSVLQDLLSPASQDGGPCLFPPSLFRGLYHSELGPGLASAHSMKVVDGDILEKFPILSLEHQNVIAHRGKFKDRDEVMALIQSSFKRLTTL